MKSSERARARRLERFFNLTAEDWGRIDEYQGSLCAICWRPQKSGKRLATDHSHKTGLVRGLLCSTCNRLLGRIERAYANGTDVIEILERLASFLKKAPASLALGREVYTFAGRFGTKRHRKYLAGQKK